MTGNGSNSIWLTPNLTERLTELYTVGKLSTARVADKLSREFGIYITRNSVIGRVSRLKLPPNRPSGFRDEQAEHRRAGPRKRRSNGGARVPAPKLNPRQFVCVEADAIPLHISLFDLTDATCRYPYGDGPYTFCGNSTIPQSSYCGAHHAICFLGTREGVGRAVVELRQREHARQRAA